MRFKVFRTFLAKNSILAYISLKIGNLGKIGNYDVIHGMFVLFWCVWKEVTHSYTMVPNKHTSGIFFFKFIGGCNPPWLDVLQKIAWLDNG